jgi:MtN3 and saliva related transmembrane protein
MINVEAIGGVAAILTTASFIPQAIKTIRTGDTSAISFAMYAMFTTGIAFWLAYGLMLASRPIIIANAVTFILAGVILAYKAKAVALSRVSK